MVICSLHIYTYCGGSAWVPLWQPLLEWDPYHYEACKRNPALEGWPCYPKQGFTRATATQGPHSHRRAKKRIWESAQNRNQYQTGIHYRSSWS